MSEPAEWERILLSPPPKPVPLAPPLRVQPSAVHPGMRIYNGYDPYWIVTGVEPTEDDKGALTRITYRDGNRTYRGEWADGHCMPVATPSVIISE